MLMKILIGTAAVLVTLAAIAAIMNAAEGGPAASAALKAPTRDRPPRSIAAVHGQSHYGADQTWGTPY
jgi:hypothetical protein